MSTTSNIEWTEKTWNPTVGCSIVSAGCTNCYAMKMAHRLAAMGQRDYVGLAVKKNGNAVWNGTLRTLEHRLTDPFKWRKPCKVFVNSMSDLFHEDVPFDFIDKVFAVMALCPQHTFQVLTKRPERMAEYMNSRERMGGMVKLNLPIAPVGVSDYFAEAWYRGLFFWPPSNVWLGTSCENQKAADERIPHLLRCSAAVRFISAEPLLGPVNIQAAINRMPWQIGGGDAGLHWVIVGGESGPGARPCNIDWIRSIVQQCRAAGVACFVKQMGAQLRMTFDEWVEHWQSLTDKHGFKLDRPHADDGTWTGVDRKGGDMSEWPEDLRVRNFPTATVQP